MSRAKPTVTQMLMIIQQMLKAINIIDYQQLTAILASKLTTPLKSRGNNAKKALAGFDNGR